MTQPIFCLLLAPVALVVYLGIVWICLEAMKDMGASKISKCVVAIFPPLVLLFIPYGLLKLIIKGLK